MTAYTSTEALAALLLIEPNGRHERIPHGVPGNYAWWSQGITSGGNKPVSGTTNLTYTNPYGQLYAANDGNPQPDALVEVRELNQWLLDSKGVWTPVYSTPPIMGGALYPENFIGPTLAGNLDQKSIPGSAVISPGAPGINPGNPAQGYLFHVFPGQARAQIPQPADIQGVFVACRARLVPGSYLTWNVAAPGLIYDVGADYWGGPASGPDVGIGQSRFKLVKPDWRAFIYSTLTSTQVKAIQVGTLAAPPVAFDVAELY